MNRQEAANYCKSHLTDYLDKITQKRGKMYICPICGSGTGANKTPALSANGELWQCFSCHHSGDIFNLIAEQYEKDCNTDFVEILDIAIGVFGLNVYDEYKAENKQYTHNKQNAEQTYKTQKAAKVDYTEFLRDCKAAAEQTDFYARRGIDPATVERFNLGYCTAEIAEKHAEACNIDRYLTGYAVIPYNRCGGYWIARNTAAEPNERTGYKWRKPKTEHAGSEPLYNTAELDRASAEPIFITEAPIDSVSIMQAGGRAIATGGTGAEKLAAALDRSAIDHFFIIAYDNDNPGREATERVKSILEGKNKKYKVFIYPENIKDCNAYLMTNKEDFYKTVRDYIEEAKTAAEIEQEQEREAMATEYNQDTAKSRLYGFLDGIKYINTPATPTGFGELDRVLDGGLYEGLYILGAVSSLGKTTLVLQIADQIAKAGNDILIFSLEMAANELIAKSISRETLLHCRENSLQTSNAKTVRGITDRQRHKNYTETEKHTINAAIKKYSDYAGNIIIKEGLGNIGVSQIRETVERHRAARGKDPVIIVDYLQILAPYNDRASDKQNTDKAVLELKRISRDYKIPVVAISSFNRDNYSAAASMTAFKESGAIEYSSDVLIALQPQGMKEASTDGEKKDNRKAVLNCKKREIRPIEAVILKNRNGATGGTVEFDYYALFNFFEETRHTQADFTEPIDL